jgi:hypothetical protein
VAHVIFVLGFFLQRYIIGTMSYDALSGATRGE